MPCYPIKIGDTVGVICTRGSAPKRKSCKYCGKPATLECDYPLGNGKICYAPVCPSCSVHVAPDTDYCKTHKQATVKAGVNPWSEFGKQAGPDASH